jgi:hypothetical protein
VSPVAVGPAMFAALPVIARQSGGHLSAEWGDIGRVEPRSENSDQVLGVATWLSRPLGVETERDDVCFSQAAAGRCHGVARRRNAATLTAMSTPGRGLPLIALTEPI